MDSPIKRPGPPKGLKMRPLTEKELMPRKGNKKPGSGKKELLPKKSSTPSKKKVLPLTGKEAILKEYQKSISPKGMAKTKAEQTAALDALMKKRYGKKK
jgi:hypothetical protein